MWYEVYDHKPLGVCATGVLINRSVTNGDDGIDMKVRPVSGSRLTSVL